MRVGKTKEFNLWLLGLKDIRGQTSVSRRIDRLMDGNFGVRRSLGESLSELKIDYGPGYRMYYVQRGETVIILLCGGDKGSQKRDILRAKQMVEVDEGTLIWHSK